MTEASKANVRRVSLQERALPVGNVIGINGYKVNRAALRKQIEEEGYHVHETPNFFVVLRSEFPSIIVIHWFAPEALDASLGDYILQELKPLGVLTGTQDFDDVFGAVVGSLFPYNTQQAWYTYTANTLQRFLFLLNNITPASSLSFHSTFDTFARLYHRVYELQVGERFLDAGCSSGYLPLLMAEHFPSLSKNIGVDIRSHPFETARMLAKARGLKNVQFVQADLLDENVIKLGSFDTITMLHVLEHFTEGDMYNVLTNLLKITAQRLIIAVPYERGIPEKVYGHEQLFSQAKLEDIGRWCLQQWHGSGRMWYENCADGLLVLDRYPS